MSGKRILTILSLFILVSLAVVTTPVTVNAGNNNPVLPGYNADPQIAVFNSTFYMYPTTDGIANWGATSFQAWSSTDMIHWTNRGVILDLANVSWCHSNAWSPSILQKGSTYYFYFTACSEIGVATSSSPTGPFTDALGKPLVSKGQYGVTAIDPAVFIDDGGQAYLLFGNGGARLGPLASNMTSFSGTPVNISPSGAQYREAPYMFKRNGTYYLTWSEDDTRNATYHVSYAKSGSITGPFAGLGSILSENTSLGILGPGSASIWGASTGQYYIVYHRFKIPGGDGTHREVVIDPLNFNSNGTIQNVAVSLTGLQSAVSPNPNNPQPSGGGGTTTTYDDESSAFVYTGSHWNHTACNGGDHCYNNTNSWESTTNEYVVVSFIGTQIKLYAVTDKNLGYGAVSIDGGSETNVDFYSNPRNSDVLVWTSPTLTKGSHTLKIRITGTHDGSSTGNTIALDRADVLP